MSISLAQLAAATVEREIGGRSWTFSPLTLADLAAIQTWYCERPLVSCQNHLRKYADMYSDAEADKLRADSRAEYKLRNEVMQKLEPDEDKRERVRADMLREFSSMDGIARFAYMSLRHCHPDITPEQAGELIDVASLQAISEIIDLLSMPQKDHDTEVLLADEKKTASKPAA